LSENTALFQIRLESDFSGIWENGQILPKPKSATALYFSNSDYSFRMALPSNFGMEIHLQNILVTVQFQGHGSKVKVTEEKKRWHATQKLPVRSHWDLIGIYVTIILVVIWSFWHLTLAVDLETNFHVFFFNLSSKF